MNICIFIRELSLGGAEKQSLLLSKALQDKYPTYLVILRDNTIEKRYLDYIRNEKIEAIFLSGNILRKIFQFIRFLRKNNITIIFSYLFSNNIIGIIAGRIAKVPFVIGGIRNCLIVRKKFIPARFMHNRLLTCSIFNNYSGLDNLSKKGFLKEKAIVIPNCIEMNKSSRTDRIENLTGILTIARFMPQKDYLTALMAIDHLHTKLTGSSKKIQYTIVGYGPEEFAIRNFIKSKNLENYVRIVIKPDNLDTYLEEADIYLSTSLYEGLSNSIMEAMSFSLPIIATDVGDNCRLIDNDKNGFLVGVHDYQTISDKLFYLISNPDVLMQFGKYSYRKLYENYSFEKFSKRYFEFIEGLSSEKS